MSLPEDVRDVAVLVSRALEKAGIDYAIGGSVASSFQGEPRFTNDIDFAVRLSDAQIPKLVAALGSEFSVDEEALAEAVRLRRSSNIFYLPLVTKIDLFVRGGEPFDESELARRVRVKVGSQGDEVWLASPEDNLLRKLLWYRAGGQVSDQQWRDITGIARIVGPSLDRSYLLAWARRLGVEDLLKRTKLVD